MVLFARKRPAAKAKSKPVAKRPAANGKVAVARSSKAASHFMKPADILKQCKEVTDILQPDEAQAFLPAHLAPVFGPVLPQCVEALRKEPSQMPYVVTLAKALSEGYDDIKERVAEAAETVKAAQQKKQVQKENQEKAQSELEDAEEEVRKLEELLTSTSATIASSKTKIEAAKAVKRETIVQHQEISAKRRKIEKVNSDAYEPLKKGLDGTKLSGKLSQLMPMLKSELKLNKSLTAAIPSVLKQSPADRSTSDSFVLRQLEDAIQLELGRAALVPSVAQLDDDVHAAEEAFQAAKRKEKAQADLLKAAQETVKVKARAAKEEEKKSEECAQELLKAQEAVDLLSLRSTNFHDSLCYGLATLMVVGVAGGSLAK